MATMTATELDELFRESRSRINRIARGEMRDQMETQHLGEGIYVGVPRPRTHPEHLVAAGFPIREG